ncbi:hypothetical protein FH972_015133 [Carpinus fangiana]|uniref:Uncharacterized protein n=1 Tax=Carpinus fangiana TaxID=176857 RepID=A0A5N6RDM7_9ROSI|nr:hypothetical protein FH972_015133 [Carpinus fangiana]
MGLSLKARRDSFKCEAYEAADQSKPVEPEVKAEAAQKVKIGAFGGFVLLFDYFKPIPLQFSENKNYQSGVQAWPDQALRVPFKIGGHVAGEEQNQAQGEEHQPADQQPRNPLHLKQCRRR